MDGIQVTQHMHLKGSCSCSLFFSKTIRDLFLPPFFKETDLSPIFLAGWLGFEGFLDNCIKYSLRLKNNAILDRVKLF